MYFCFHATSKKKLQEKRQKHIAVKHNRNFIPAALWKVTVEFVSNSGRKKEREKAAKDNVLADQKFQKLVEQGVEPHPGPASSQAQKLGISSLNVQSEAGLREVAPSHGIVCFQETHMHDQTWKKFQRSGQNKGFSAYHAEGPKSTRGGFARGGICFLIERGAPSIR